MRKIVSKREKITVPFPTGKKQTTPFLERFDGNPILEPRPENWWESKAVFNPAAIYEGGRVHILYRAIGDSDTSVIGYASSADGFHIDERLDTPAYVPREPFEGFSRTHPTAFDSLITYVSAEDDEEDESDYISGGGGWGGCEDPRLTRIDDRVYMTYVAFDGYSPPRVALTSININDFLAKNWLWEKPVLISPPEIVDKNACILPEKIDSKYVIFHRIFPDILVDFVDTLDFDGVTGWLKGEFRIPARPSHWDSRKLGIGAPPIKTKEGWLTIYQGVDERDPARYKIGAMLLDLKNPTHVLARSAQPILEPEAWYENEGWKAGVVYPCGAVVINEHLLVYYGGADRVTCVADVKLETILKHLIEVRTMPPGIITTPSPAFGDTSLALFLAYCMKCKAKREMHNSTTITLKNGRTALQGICSVCGTKMSRITKP